MAPGIFNLEAVFPLPAPALVLEPAVQGAAAFASVLEGCLDPAPAPGDEPADEAGDGEARVFPAVLAAIVPQAAACPPPPADTGAAAAAAVPAKVPAQANWIMPAPCDAASVPDPAPQRTNVVAPEARAGSLGAAVPERARAQANPVVPASCDGASVPDMPPQLPDEPPGAPDPPGGGPAVECTIATADTQPRAEEKAVPPAVPATARPAETPPSPDVEPVRPAPETRASAPPETPACAPPPCREPFREPADEPAPETKPTLAAAPPETVPVPAGITVMAQPAGDVPPRAESPAGTAVPDPVIRAAGDGAALPVAAPPPVAFAARLEQPQRSAEIPDAPQAPQQPPAPDPAPAPRTPDARPAIPAGRSEEVAAPRPSPAPRREDPAYERPGAPPVRPPSATVPAAFPIHAASPQEAPSDAPAPPRDPGMVELPAEPAAPPHQPAREIVMRLPDSPERIEIRMAERAGEVRVAVHAADAEVRRTLQENLPELVRGFEGAGFTAQAWRAGESASARSDTGDRGGASQDPQGGGQGGGAQQDGRGRRREPHSPAWFEEVGRSMARGDERSREDEHRY